MAGLNDSVPRLPTPGEQLAAIAWVRGRLFLSSFRSKGGKGELIARFFLLPFMAVLAVGPIVGAGAGAFYIVSQNEYRYFALLLWIVYVVWQTFTISAKAAAPTFDLTMLLRFPLRFSTYLLIRMLFSLLDTPTVICTLALLSASIGAGIARPSLFVPAALIFLLLDLTILFFFRMIFLWFDRFFAERKTREVLIGVFVVAMLGFQGFNITFNPGFSDQHDPVSRAKHRQRVAAMKHYGHIVEPVLSLLPPGLASTAMTGFSRGTPSQSVAPMVALCAYGAAFLALYARRLRGEFRGESFNEAPAIAAIPEPSSVPSVEMLPAATIAPASPPAGVRLLSPTVIACMAKDLRYLRRSGPLLMPLIGPVFMVFILVSRNGFLHRSPEWVLPSALAYVLLGLTAGMYNILGTEGPGVNLYFLAPINIRDIVVAKNLFTVILIVAEIAITSAVVLSSNAVPPASMLCSIYLWVAFTLLLSLTVGNIRSVYSPRVVDLSKMRQGKQSQINVLLGLLLLLLCLALGAGVIYLSRHVEHPWLPVPVFAVLTVGALTFYRMNLNHISQIALDRREVISAELCRI